MSRAEEPAKQGITEMLREWSSGNTKVIDDLIPLVYDELHRQAKRYLRRERQGHTLQTTALIHEAYLKLINQRDVEWESRSHFYAIAAQAMRRILVDYARSGNRKKRGGPAIGMPLDETAEIAEIRPASTDFIALDQALTRLEKLDSQQARVVELRYFADMTLEEAASILRISRATAARDWSVAKSWLFRELSR